MPQPTLCRNWLRNNAHARELCERWYRSEIKNVTDPQHAQALRQFTTWRLLPRCGPGPPGSS